MSKRSDGVVESWSVETMGSAEGHYDELKRAWKEHFPD